MAKTITSADSTFALSVTNLFPTAQNLQGYAADAMFSMGDTEFAQTQRGADGKLSAGFVFGQYLQTITIMPDSDSYDLVQTWMKTSRTAIAVFRCNATIIIPGMQAKFTLSNGVLVRGKAMPDAQRVLQAITFQIDWENVTAEPFSS